MVDPFLRFIKKKTPSRKPDFSLGVLDAEFILEDMGLGFGVNLQQICRLQDAREMLLWRQLWTLWGKASQQNRRSDRCHWCQGHGERPGWARVMVNNQGNGELMASSD